MEVIEIGLQINTKIHSVAKFVNLLIDKYTSLIRQEQSGISQIYQSLQRVSQMQIKHLNVNEVSQTSFSVRMSYYEIILLLKLCKENKDNEGLTDICFQMIKQLLKLFEKPNPTIEILHNDKGLLKECELFLALHSESVVAN
jgi:hypothetical protein